MAESLFDLKQSDSVANKEVRERTEGYKEGQIENKRKRILGKEELLKRGKTL